jgi:hypothetical protein
MIPKFWKIKDGLPRKFVAKLKKLLPEAYQICGDTELTAQCLEYVLDEKVRLRSSMKAPDYIEERTAGGGMMGESILGTDFIPGNHAGGFISSLTFQVGPVTNHENINLIENGSMDRFLDCFYGYFIPLELDVGTKYVFSAEESIFMLNEEKDKPSYLAYNSVI